MMQKNKPELLAPVGKPESLYAAINAGADAVYMGLTDFNARGRASNFSRSFMQMAVRKAKEKNIEVYITLNILVKNREIEKIIDILLFLEALKVDAVIIQDWGLYYILNKYFPEFVIHASTQLGVHNSIGVNYNFDKGIKRTVLARELRLSELSQISKLSTSELEVFVHGALCYSFSGMCLFSSYVGGQGANRGLCKQNCRRIYNSGLESKTIFSLKDNQQIENIRKLMSIGIHSLKIEGRMKTADYVYQVCKAYRQVIDGENNEALAGKMLELDLGREKTQYFLGDKLNNEFTSDISTGQLVGEIISSKNGTVTFSSNIELSEGFRLRVRIKTDNEQIYLKLENYSVEGNTYKLSTDLYKKIKSGDDVLLVNAKLQSFSSRLGNPDALPKLKIRHIRKTDIIKDLQISSRKLTKPLLYVRIGSSDWLPKLRVDDYDFIILSFNRKDLQKFNFNNPQIRNNKEKICVELPKFIPENKIEFYREIVQNYYKNGYKSFFISHLSQKVLIPSGASVSCSENVYSLNDAAVKMLDKQKIKDFIYPFENDFENLASMQNKNGIVPLYFYPALFYSRMPVKISKIEDFFSDETNKKYRRVVKDGLTNIYPSIPVALLHFRNQLEKIGFMRFLIDYSGDIKTANVVKRVLKKYIDKESIQPSGNFNFKLGLK